MKYLLICLAVLGVFGCATTGTGVKTEAPTVATFDWNPPESAPTNSGGVTFGIVGGSYATEELWNSVYPFNTFRDNMRVDFQEMLAARGFATTGPFENADEMTFPDKKSCDLVLRPGLDLTLDVSNANVEEHVNLLKANHYTLAGNGIIRGRVTLNIVESLSGTSMWNKSVSLEPITFAWIGEHKYELPPQGVNLADPGLQKAAAGPLEKAYQEILAKAWAYMDPGEMQLVKQQAGEVKAKTGYSGS